MRRLVARALVLALALTPVPTPAASPRPVDLPLPELDLTVVPLALNVQRPTFEPPAPPAPAWAVEAALPPLPRFVTAVAKPSPPARDPGGTACTFAFGRASALAECGIHRVLQGDLRGARESLEASLDKEVRGAQAALAYVWLGEVGFREGRADEAERRYRTALSLNPPTELAAPAALGAGWLALRRAAAAEAQSALAQALTGGVSPAVSVLARFLDGVARLLAGRPEEALPVWDAVTASGPPGELADELLFWRGVAGARLGQAEAALQALDRFLAAVPASHPLRADAIAQSGWVALARGVPDDAIRRFLWAQGSSPRAELLAQLRAGLARAYLALGDSARARDAARLLAAESARDPLLPGVLLLLADDALRRNAPADAVDSLRQLLALQLDPRLAEYATYRLAESLERQGATAEAERQYRVLRETGRVEAIAQRAADRLGLLALRARRPADARAEGEALLRAGVLPELREAALLLTAEGAARADDANRAVSLFRVVLRDYPDSAHTPVVRLLLGWALLRDGEPESALREWEQARLATDLDVAVPAHLAIAELALRQGHEADSLAALQELGRLAPGHPLAETLVLNRGVLLLRAKEYERAVQELEPLTQAIKTPALQAVLRRALGLARYRLQHFDAAEREFGWAVYWAPAEPSNTLALGLAALARNRFPEAEKALGIARLAAAPEVAAPAAYALVVAAHRRRDDALFQERATALVDRYPTHPYTALVLYGLVRLALDSRELDRADAWAKRLVRDQPASEYVPDALGLLAEAAARERPALARQTYGEILARVRDAGVRSGAWIGLAGAALALGEGAEAQRALDGFLQETAPDDPRAPRALALAIRAQEVQGRRDRALAAAETFLQRFPTHSLAPAIQLTRGHYFLIDQQWEPARQALEAARDTGEPEVAAPAQFYLGELHRSRGEHEAALAAYLGATYLYPEANPWAARGLQGAIQSYLALQKPREASILLRKLLARAAVEPDLAQWARRALTQLGPITGEDPAEVLRKGAAR